MDLDLITAEEALQVASNYINDEVPPISHHLLYIISKKIRAAADIGDLYTIQILEDGRWRTDQIDFVKFNLTNRKFLVKHITFGILNMFYTIPELLIIKWNNV